MMDQKHIGAHNELLATVWLLKRGYEVFRNISQHGDIDLIALKDGKAIHLDVKAAQYTVDGYPGTVKIKPRQIEAGVKVLMVYPDGECAIDLAPEPSGQKGHRVCQECATDFKIWTKRQRFCSPKCRSVDWMRRKREKLGIRVVP